MAWRCCTSVGVGAPRAGAQGRGRRDSSTREPPGTRWAPGATPGARWRVGVAGEDRGLVIGEALLQMERDQLVVRGDVGVEAEVGHLRLQFAHLHRQQAVLLAHTRARTAHD